MRKNIPISLIFILGFLTSSCDKTFSPRSDYPLEPVSFTDVHIEDEFWAPKMEVNRKVSIWHCFEMYEETGRLASPKLIEGAAYMLAERSDPELEAYVDDLIDESVARVESRIKDDPESAVRVSGHFFEAAVAYFEATGKKKMLDAAIKAADQIDAIYGPGKKTYIAGHEGLKIGLIRLYRHTGDERYWKLAKFFLDEKGKEDYERTERYAKYRTFNQDHKPVVKQSEAVGHCVRAMFLYIPLADIAALTGETAYVDASERIWQDSVYKKTYIIGGIGAVRFHEQYGAAYELPNLSCWNETCAAYGNAVWNHRLFLLHQDAKYIDMMERILYNGWLVGVSYQGDRFFYQNPLKSFGDYERFRWINVPCCPPNVVRLMASIGSYIYAKSGKDIYVNLFIGSQSDIKLDRTTVNITQETKYPWEGKVKIIVEPEPEEKFALHVRLPIWTRNQPMPGDLYHFMEAYEQPPALTVNSEAVEYEVEKGFARVERKWKRGDVLELDFPMRVRKVLPNRKIQDNEGRVALERGPLVYCVEWADNDENVLNLLLQDNTMYKAEFREDLLGGVTVVKGEALALYRGEDIVTIKSKKHETVAIPFYAWANRGMGEMAVWLARREDKARVKPIVPPFPIVRVSSFGEKEKGWTGYNDQNDDIVAVYDGVDPISSADESNLYFRMTPPEGKPAWVEYEFEALNQVSSTEVYFVDDRRFCRLPQSWRILYKDGDRWSPVENLEPYRVEKDKFNVVTFTPVKTTALRLEVEPQNVPYRAGQFGPPAAMPIEEDIVWREVGIIEWRVKGGPRF